MYGILINWKQRENNQFLFNLWGGGKNNNSIFISTDLTRNKKMKVKTTSKDMSWILNGFSRQKLYIFKKADFLRTSGNPSGWSCRGVMSCLIWKSFYLLSLHFFKNLKKSYFCRLYIFKLIIKQNNNNTSTCLL